MPRVGWSTSYPARLTPRKDPVPTVQENGWPSGPVWTGEENLARTVVRTPDRPLMTRTELSAELAASIFRH
jgi:hypothetical protein